MVAGGTYRMSVKNLSENYEISINNKKQIQSEEE